MKTIQFLAAAFIGVALLMASCAKESSSDQASAQNKNSDSSKFFIGQNSGALQIAAGRKVQFFVDSFNVKTIKKWLVNGPSSYKDSCYVISDSNNVRFLQAGTYTISIDIRQRNIGDTTVYVCGTDSLKFAVFNPNLLATRTRTVIVN